ncbi:serine/threonine-protein kinase [Gemmata sp.]|uniref:serine/threonine-protein kinase n=1 Tax=Gemmata sp. TaxID=1914242 RepID=UPI003F6EEEBA
MPHDDVSDALADWQRRHASGDPVTPEELCKDTPQLLPELRGRIAAVRAAEQLAQTHTAGTDGIGAGGTLSDGRTPAPTFGGLTVVRVIGEGGMGRVLEAHDAKLGRRVAVKEMRPQLAADAHSRERFLREARAAAAVRHDHIVPVYHVGERDGAPFLVMPLLEGESLADRLARANGPLPPGEVARLGREAALGLAAAHKAGLVHRDIKPANLWLEAPHGRLLVLDFGLARSVDGVDGMTLEGSVLGTPGYLAPEQANGLPVDGRADLFSLGVTLYQAATGTRPFQGPTLTAVLRAVAEHHPQPPHEVNLSVPAVLSDLIMRLLAKNPVDRPATATAVAEELASPLPSDSQRATALFPTPPPTATGKPRRMGIVAGIGVAALALVVAIWVLTRPGTQPVAVDKDSPVGPALTPVPPPVPPVRYRGSVDVKVERGTRLVRLTEPGALPLRPQDKFVIEGRVEPAAYLYLLWVDPEHDVTPVYPWNPEKGWGSRPAKEVPTVRLRLPAAGETYRAPNSKPGVATMVLFARATPLDAPDDEVRKWFETLPELPLPASGEGSAVWFDDYTECDDPNRLRTFEKVAQDDPFARWQGQLRNSLEGKAAFQSAVSFARTGRK